MRALFVVATVAAAWAADGPAFEAATVKIASPPTVATYQATGGPGTSSPGRFRGPSLSMSAILQKAFGVEADQLQAPEWVTGNPDRAYYAVEAVMPSATTKAQFEAMFQRLLAERFHLEFHHETRSFPGYELVVDQGGPKIRRVTQDPNPDADPLSFRSAGADGFPAVRGPVRVTRPGGDGTRRIKFQEQTIAELAAALMVEAGQAQGKLGKNPADPRPRVIDKTGLPDRYTFILEYFNPMDARFFAASAPTLGESPQASHADDLFTALRKQLGLKLNQVAAVPQDVIVIDRLEKTPTPE